MYAIAFNAISDALEELDKLNIGAAKECLKEAQFHTEEIYISQDSPDSSSPDGTSKGQVPTGFRHAPQKRRRKPFFI